MISNLDFCLLSLKPILEVFYLGWWMSIQQTNELTVSPNHTPHSLSLAICSLYYSLSFPGKDFCEKEGWKNPHSSLLAEKCYKKKNSEKPTFSYHTQLLKTLNLQKSWKSSSVTTCIYPSLVFTNHPLSFSIYALSFQV